MHLHVCADVARVCVGGWGGGVGCIGVCAWAGERGQHGVLIHTRGANGSDALGIKAFALTLGAASAVISRH
jgi:hypothetical protein